MKTIESRLSQLENKTAGGKRRRFCVCPPEIMKRPPVTKDQLPPKQDTGKKQSSGICPRCGGLFDKDHPAAPVIVLQPVKA